MGNVKRVASRKERAVTALVRAHFDEAPTLREAVWLRSGEQADEVRLVHIDDTAIETPDVQAFLIGRSAEFPYALHLAHVSPRQWAQIGKGTLKLPGDWTLQGAVRFPRSKNGA